MLRVQDVKRGPHPDTRGPELGAGTGLIQAASSFTSTSSRGSEAIHPLPSNSADFFTSPMKTKCTWPASFFLSPEHCIHARVRARTHTHPESCTCTLTRPSECTPRIPRLTPRASSFYNRSQSLTSQTGSQVLGFLKVSGNNLISGLLKPFFSLCLQLFWPQCLLISSLSLLPAETQEMRGKKRRPPLAQAFPSPPGDRSLREERSKGFLRNF